MTETVVTDRGMVVAPHADAALAGADILRAGGNAIEAMIAAAATIAVVYPHMNHVGGDGFWLVAEPRKSPLAIAACGPAAQGAARARYELQGFDTIPTRGPWAALTVPGTVGGWALAREIAAAWGGRLPLPDLLAPAITHARAGVRVTRSHASLAAAKHDELTPQPGYAATFCIDGKPPTQGAALRQPVLADTLDFLAHEGLDQFYRGDVGATLADDLVRAGSPVTRADLEAYRARLVTPLSLTTSAGTLFNLPPPTQGLASLLILGIADRLMLGRPDSFASTHGLIEATKRAFIARDRVITDPAHLTEDPAELLTPRWLEQQAQAIDRHRAAPWPHKAAPGDTIWMGAIDAEGRAVSFIQSIYWEFGSGVVSPRTGVLMQNRGASFSLDPRARNPLAPGRLPFHTLNPALARMGDGRTVVYGTMGGDGQPQTQAQIFTRAVLADAERGGGDVWRALDAPRWLLGRTWGSTTTALRVEPRFDPDLIRALERAGHRVETVDEPYSDTLGHAGMIIRRRDGRLYGGHDPRADGGAAVV
jgi:gamma-glutamyltranspeptidase/glutathione hydrolase